MTWDQLPQDLKQLPQWVAVSLEWDSAKEVFNKVPKNPNNGRSASVVDPDTWGTFEQATQCGAKHIGFVFTHDDPFVFIDLDTGKHKEYTELHRAIIEHAASYTETSISGAGSHIVVTGHLPDGLRDDDKGVEVYPHSRFMLATGDVYGFEQVAPGQDILNYLSTQINSSRVAVVDLVSEPSTLLDEQLYDRASEADNGDKFRALFSGKWHDYAEYFQDHSRADLALLTFLDFYSKDVEQCVRVFKMSALYRTTKGRASGDGTDYIMRTLRGARARNTADHPPLPEMDELIERSAKIIEDARQNTLIKDDIPAFDTVQEPAFTSKFEPERQEAGNLVEFFNQGPIEGPPQVVTPQGASMPLPPGLVGEIAQYLFESATRPVPEVALMGALAFVAGLAGRQYNIAGSGLNMYLILLAPTGCGKEGAATGLSNLMAKVRLQVPDIDTFKGPAEFSSGPALIKTLNKKLCFFSIIGEFGLRMQQMCDGRSSSAEKTLQKALLNLFSKSGWNQSESSSAYSDKEKNTSILFAPALTLFGETTPETFFEGLEEGHVTSGLLPRFCFLEYKGVRPARNKYSAFCDPSPGLVQRVAELAGNVLTMEQNQACALVEFDPEALALLDAFDEFADDKINSGGELYKQLWNRVHLKALRLSGLLAVGCNMYNPVVTAAMAEWSILFAKNDVALIEDRFDSGEAGTGEVRFEKAIRRAVTEYLTMGIPERIKRAKVPAELAEHMAVIPYKYLREKLRRQAAFYRDRRGATACIKSAIDDLKSAAIILEVPPLERMEKYKTRAALFAIGENWEQGDV